MTDVESAATSVDLSVAARIVASYVAHNALAASAVAPLIHEVHVSLQALRGQAEEPEVPLVPAVSIKRSVHDDFIVCLECGKKFKSIKRHLSTHHDLTPDKYRERWSLPFDYPMASPNYSAHRSAVAKQIGLGRKAVKATDKARRNRG